jgi:hypothetical protein
MNMIFKTKQDACDRYDKNIPRMRKVNTHKHIVLDFHNTYATVPPFNPDDASKVIQHDGYYETSGCYKG